MRSVTGMHASRKAGPDAFATTYRHAAAKAADTNENAVTDDRIGGTAAQSRVRSRVSPDDLRLETVQACFKTLPTRNFDAMNEWVFRLCGMPATNSTAAALALDGLEAVLVGKPALTSVIATARAWLQFMDQASGLCSASAATVADVADGSQRDGPAADGVALDLFLDHAARNGWFSHRDAVFTDVHGVASYVGTVRDLLMKICETAAPRVHDYLSEHVVAAQGVTHALCTGCHDRFPLIVLDTASVAFSDVMVRMTAAGLTIEGLRRLGGGVTSTPRVYVPCSLGDAQTASRAAVASLFPVPGRDCVLRSLGALLQPRSGRQGDRWTTVLVATGPAADAAMTPHPVEWLLTTFVGMSVVTSLHGVNVTDRRPGGPMVLLLKASAAGTLTPDQQSQMVLASVSDICTVVRSPYVPACMCVNEGLRLASVVVDVRTLPTREQYDAAMPHVLPVLTGAYSVTPFERRQLVTPIFDKASLVCRVEAPVTQSAVTLFGEMLQSGFGVRMVPRMHADFTRVRSVFNDYQDMRGYTGFAMTTLTAEDVVEAATVVCTYFPCLKPCGDAVQWARSTETFVNLALL